jgi:hypothetical protein
MITFLVSEFKQLSHGQSILVHDRLEFTLELLSNKSSNGRRSMLKLYANGIENELIT